MQFAGLVFEILICGLWWLLALFLCAKGAIQVAERAFQTDLIVGADVGIFLPAGTGGETVPGLILLAVAYTVGQAGRRLARGRFQEKRRAITAEVFDEHLNDKLRHRTQRVLRERLGWKGDLQEALKKSKSEGKTEAEEGRKDIRKACDIMRDYVLANGENNASYEILNHWGGMRSARNCSVPFPIAVVGGTLVVYAHVSRSGGETLVAILLAGFVLVLGCIATRLIRKAFCERSRYLSEAILRGFFIVWDAKHPETAREKGPMSEEE